MTNYDVLQNSCNNEFYDIQALLLKPTLLGEKFIEFTYLSYFPLVLCTISGVPQIYSYEELIQDE